MRNQHCVRLVLAVCATLACSLGNFPSCAADPTPADLRGPAFNLVAENDMVVRTDRHYTHGTKLTRARGFVLSLAFVLGAGFSAITGYTGMWLAVPMPAEP